MKVLWISLYVPAVGWDHAGGQFISEVASDLVKAGVSLDVIAPRTVDNLRLAAFVNPRVGVELIPLPPLFRSNLISKLLYLVTGGVPYGAIFARRVARYVRKLQSRWEVGQGGWDIVEIQWSDNLRVAQRLRSLLPQTPLVVFFHDVIWQSISRRRSHANLLAVRLAFRIRELAGARLERRGVAFCDACLVLSEKDRQIVQGKYGFSGPCGVVRPYFPVRPDMHINNSRSSLSRAENLVVLMTGAMFRKENSEGARWFIERCWPDVSAAVPRARLYIVGSSPPKWLQGMASTSVTVTGFVDSLTDYYLRADVFVCPLKLGAGVKFKMLEAMSIGIPAVATPVAAEGIISPSDAAGVRIVDRDPEDFTEAVIDALRNVGVSEIEKQLQRRWLAVNYSTPTAAQILSFYSTVLVSRKD